MVAANPKPGLFCVGIADPAYSGIFKTHLPPLASIFPHDSAQLNLEWVTLIGCSLQSASLLPSPSQLLKKQTISMWCTKAFFLFFLFPFWLSSQEKKKTILMGIWWSKMPFFCSKRCFSFLRPSKWILFRIGTRVPWAATYLCDTLDTLKEHKPRRETADVSLFSPCSLNTDVFLIMVEKNYMEIF